MVIDVQTIYQQYTGDVIEDGIIVAPPMPTQDTSLHGVGSVPTAQAVGSGGTVPAVVIQAGTDGSAVLGLPAGSWSARLQGVYGATSAEGVDADIREHRRSPWQSFEGTPLLSRDRDVAVSSDYCCLAWLSALLCFWPLGICAVFYSMQTVAANNHRDSQSALKYSRLTLTCSMLAMTIGLIIYYFRGSHGWAWY